MNREILFRGKRVDNGEWIEGNLILQNLIGEVEIPVYDESSVGCGVEDNGCNDRYEGAEYAYNLAIDEVFQNTVEVIPETVGQYINRIDRQGNKVFEGDIFIDQTVTWCDDTSSFYLKDKYNSDYNESLKELHFMEITGNIHDKQ